MMMMVVSTNCFYFCRKTVLLADRRKLTVSDCRKLPVPNMSMRHDNVIVIDIVMALWPIVDDIDPIFISHYDL
jgi:hypothetical protein